MKYFDTIKEFEFSSINCKDSVVTSLSSNETQLLSGHEDGYVKLTFQSFLLFLKIMGYEKLIKNVQ